MSEHERNDEARIDEQEGTREPRAPAEGAAEGLAGGGEQAGAVESEDLEALGEMTGEGGEPSESGPEPR